MDGRHAGVPSMPPHTHVNADIALHTSRLSDGQVSSWFAELSGSRARQVGSTLFAAFVGLCLWNHLAALLTRARLAVQCIKTRANLCVHALRKWAGADLLSNTDNCDRRIAHEGRQAILQYKPPLIHKKVWLKPLHCVGPIHAINVRAASDSSVQWRKMQAHCDIISTVMEHVRLLAGNTSAVTSVREVVAWQTDAYVLKAAVVRCCQGASLGQLSATCSSFIMVACSSDIHHGDPQRQLGWLGSPAPSKPWPWSQLQAVRQPPHRVRRPALRCVPG